MEFGVQVCMVNLHDEALQASERWVELSQNYGNEKSPKIDLPNKVESALSKKKFTPFLL